MRRLVRNLPQDNYYNPRVRSALDEEPRALVNWVLCRKMTETSELLKIPRPPPVLYLFELLLARVYLR